LPPTQKIKKLPRRKEKKKLGKDEEKTTLSMHVHWILITHHMFLYIHIHFTLLLTKKQEKKLENRYRYHRPPLQFYIAPAACNLAAILLPNPASHWVIYPTHTRRIS
jgi:hypothetical protein